MIDGDRQSNTTTTFLGKRVSPSLTEVLMRQVKLTEAIYEARHNLYIVPSDTNLDHSITYLRDHPAAFYNMQKALQQLDGQGIDYVFIDQAGAFSLVMHTLLLACTEMLVPCELEPYAVQGLFDMFKKLEVELEDHRLKNAGVIPYNTDMSKSMTTSYQRELVDTFRELVLPAVRTDTSVPYAQSQKMTIFEYEETIKRKSRAADDFVRVATLLEHQRSEVRA